MKAIVYRNTITTIPNWVKDLHLSQPLGYAYETTTHFVHFYAYNSGWYTIHEGLTVTEGKSGTLEDWVTRVFGAENIQSLTLSPGESIDGVWRPGLSDIQDVFKALNVTGAEVRLTEQALRLLINRLDDLFLFIEPDANGLMTYSHKTRELLILACTEVENFWKQYMDKAGVIVKGNRFTTNEYVRLLSTLHLAEFQFTLRSYTSIPPINPFAAWDILQPTTSLAWYDAYNKTKHDRDSNFSEATLMNCINAVVANLVMYCIKFGPIEMAL